MPISFSPVQRVNDMEPLIEQEQGKRSIVKTERLLYELGPISGSRSPVGCREVVFMATKTARVKKAGAWGLFL